VAEVRRVETLTPHMIRVVLSGDGLEGFACGEFTDHYVKLLFPPAGAPYGHPVDVEHVEETHERAHWPVTRTYTVRRWDADTGELTVDFVYHGDEGIAGPWAKNARPGDQIAFLGPGGAYAPDPEADWHLFIGDESALPAIAASLERLPAGVPAVVIAEVEDDTEEQALECAGELSLTWVHRAGPAAGAGIEDIVRSADLPAGRVHAFVHGDAGFVRAVRRHLRSERGMPREAMSVSGYWRRGRTEEGWRAEKPEWKRAVDGDEAALAAQG
jgi:NADPH-dependent ferric siderophore reductase